MKGEINMIVDYKLDAEDEKIINELDNLCGVIQNKEVLKDIILYIKLKQNNELDFGNYNIIIRSNSTYNLINDLLKVCAKIFIKYGVIKNDKIRYLDKIINRRRGCPFDKIYEIEDSIIVINERKLGINYADELDNLKRVINQFKDKVFVFEDSNFCEGETDGILGELACWRMTIEKISLDDKITHCINKFNEQGLSYKKQDLKEYANVPFWILKNMIVKLIIECKSKNISSIDKQMLNKNKDFFSKSVPKRKTEQQSSSRNNEKSAQDELNELIGLYEVKYQINKILNYIKLNKERGNMPTLHMCFTGNPGTGKTSIARIIGRLFEQENILSGNGEFVEIHGRDLVAKYVGWTAQKVHETVEKAIGGVLFIDEAYSLVADRRGSFEDEAIATLIKEMEDHRNEICIILAGYTNEMKNLIKLNPGFESRIQFYIDFPNYNEDELYEIFRNLVKKDGYKISGQIRPILMRNFEENQYNETFSNGRYVRNLYEKVKIEQANRVTLKDNEDINLIKKCDIEEALRQIQPIAVKKNRIGFASG